MSDILDSPEVLKLNAIHEPIRIVTPRKAFGDLTSDAVDERTGEYIRDSKGRTQIKMKAYLIEFCRNPDGTYQFDKGWEGVSDYRLVDWDEWITLPVRPFDLSVGMKNRRIRVPRVVMTMTYDRMPKKEFHLNFKNVYRLYKGVCAYTKKKLKLSEANMDHYIPRDKGGETSWENIRLCAKKVNSMKGNRYNHEVGLPTVPPIIPDEIPMINYLKNEKGIPEWNLILKQ